MREKLVYTMIESDSAISNVEKVLTYGLMATDQTGAVCLQIKDISTCKQFVFSLMTGFNEHGVSLVHVYDIIEDTLG